ncbi:Mitochondrial distribution and morphology protein 10 [Elasticomyces elasticus]|uniref:Mitochondrial distribution and morphology protein 10 n=1 Tax=Exophiala sideris TaxID=1016849 RepID=A0ABR0JKD9_9EURO|nr:Mitochondrial distribution and morphology protein 10 [Elasticomyces elasticus]KAK5034545.1 Mitochondrial distribution and morphology protein 10 [Exophiala sideris]KAK5042841.1 Mitochondrial distribution and morphology protein 10 [Exophiala sideris]KAK5065924.1 Mitochondrial distribution and morphology protein 10 [Exophiala sideris]KAK5185616.1 Mitochondrial distribution and morphology protein 10 [Eurotiomycetes sp. CCFEE 6388]
MIDFMDYIVHAFGASTDWNPDNSYSSLTATSDALVSFETPSTLALHVSSLSTPNFATSYTLSTLGQIDGSISYLYSTVPLAHIPSQTTSIPLNQLVRGYKDIRLPIGVQEKRQPLSEDERKPTLLHATLALPPPSVLTGLYARRINPDTLLCLSLYSKSINSPVVHGPPPASVLAHLQHDTGRYSIEGLGSSDNALLGVRGLWNFGLAPDHSSQDEDIVVGDLTDFPTGLPLPPQLDVVTAYHNRLASKPSLLSAGAEFYYSPFSHVIGLSTGLRFTTLAPHITPTPSDPVSRTDRLSPNKPLAGTSASLLSSAGHSLLTPSGVSHSSFPYTMTLTCTPLTGSISSTYSVRPTPNLALSSRFDFNFYSYESRYVVGGELWRRGRTVGANATDVDWVRTRTHDWFSVAERDLKDERVQREEENVIKFRVDDGWNVKALWTGRVKSLLVSAGVSVSPVLRSASAPVSVGGIVARSSDGDVGVNVKRWTGSVGVSIAYST